MQGVVSVGDVDQLCTRLYAGDKEVTNAFTAAGWMGCLKELGFPLLIQTLTESNSGQSIIFACRAVGECVDEVFKSQGPAAVVEMVRVVFERLRGGDRAVSSLPAQGAMGRLIALVIRSGYRQWPEVAGLPGVLLHQGEALLQSDAAAATGAAVQLRAVCSILGAVVTAVSESEPVAMTAKATGAVSTASRFRDDYLVNLYAFASAAVKRVGHSSALDSALQLLLNLMDYNITGTLRSEDGEGESWVCDVFPVAWQHVVVDAALFQRLWVLFQLGGGGGAGVSTLKSILEILTRYVGVKAGRFINATERGKWVEATLVQTHAIIEQSLHLGDDDVRALFAVLLNRIKPACSLDELTAAPSFALWLASCLRFTQGCLTERHLSDACVLSLLSMWSALGGAQSYASDAVKGLAESAALVVSAYVAAISRNIEVFVAELIQSAGSTADLDYILEDDPEGVRLQLQFVVTLAAASGKSATDCLQRFAQNAFEHAPAAILGNSATLAAATAVTAAEESAWLLRLAAVSLSETALNSDPAATETVAFFAILFMYRWTREADALGHLPEVVRSHLEAAATALCQAVSKVLLIPAYASSRKVAKGVAQRLVAAQVLDTEEGFATLWHDIVLERCWIALWAANTSVATRISGLQYVCQLATGSSALRAMKNTKAFHRFVDLDPQHAPPRGTEGPWHRIRFLYARCVAQLRLSETVLIGAPTDDVATTTAKAPSTPLTLRHLAQPILTVWDILPTTPNSDSGNSNTHSVSIDETTLLASLCDARGLLFGAPRRAFVGLVELFHVYIPRLVQCILTPPPHQKPTIVQLLKLIGEMTLNRAQRAFFGNHSALGVLLVRHAQGVVVASSSVLAAVTHDATASGAPPEDTSAWMWKVLRATMDVGRNVLRGGYCNWAALAVYDETTVSTFLTTMWPLVCNVGLVDAVQHPKVLLSLLHLVNELLIPFFAAFWESRPPGEAQYVLGLVEAVAFPSLPVQEGAKTYAVGALQRLVELCTEPRACVAATEEEAAQCRRLRYLFLSLDGDRLHRITTCCIESILSTNSALATSMGNLLRAALLAEGSQLHVVANYFRARCPTPQSADALMRICGVAAEQAVAADAEGVKSSAEQLIELLRSCL